jgi:tyrosine-protein phosphatase YwqE
MHSHLIPAVDDGSKSVEDSIKLMEGLMRLGFRKFITTPHVMAEGYRNNASTIRNGLKLLQPEMEKRFPGISLHAAAEYYLDEMFISRFDQEEMLPFGDNYLLFELSYLFRNNNIPEAIFAINQHGYKPVLAHVERYPYLHSRNLRLIREVKELGTYLQLNLLSLSGVYGGHVKRTAEQLVDEELVEFAGTDLHHEGHLAMLERALKEPYVQKLLRSDRLLNSTL